MYSPIMAETNTFTYVHFTLSSLGQVQKKKISRAYCVVQNSWTIYSLKPFIWESRLIMLPSIKQYWIF